jgi:hypothetical protein
MDPLSITASIVTVLQATYAVASICYDYSCAAKNSPWELTRVTEEVKMLRNVLEVLEQLATKAKNADPTAQSSLPALALLCEHDGPLSMCLAELEALKRKLAPPGWSGQVGSKRSAFMQALGWPLKEGDVKKTLRDIERLRDILNLALSTDQV